MGLVWHICGRRKRIANDPRILAYCDMGAKCAVKIELNIEPSGQCPDKGGPRCKEGGATPAQVF